MKMERRRDTERYRRTGPQRVVVVGWGVGVEYGETAKRRNT